MESISPLCCNIAHMHDGFWIISIYMEDWSINHSCHICNKINKFKINLN